MAEETTQVDEQDAQATAPEGEVDYEALYHKEKKYLFIVSSCFSNFLPYHTFLQYEEEE